METNVITGRIEGHLSHDLKVMGLPRLAETSGERLIKQSAESEQNRIYPIKAAAVNS